MGIPCAYKACVENNGMITKEYVELDGQKVHPQCKALAQGKVCYGCYQPVVGPSVTAPLARGKRLYHPECFKCDACGCVIRGSFKERDGMVKCESCAAIRCAWRGCKVENGIITKEYKEHEGQKYHPRCYALSQGKVCYACHDVILRRSIIAPVPTGERLYHPECFKCGTCGAPLSCSFEVVDGVVKCDSCSAVKCAYGGCEVDGGKIRKEYVPWNG